jgi:hypothetical protein
MNYCRPEVKTLGEAKILIARLAWKITTFQIDIVFRIFNPAYDLDE